MNINVRFFALYRERVGRSEQTLEVCDGTTVSNLIRILRELYGNLAPPDIDIVVAVNAEYNHNDVVLKDGDEVALIPPVSGG